MPIVFADRVKVRTRTSGTGTLTLENTVDGFQSFEAVGNGNQTYYGIEHPNGSWEIGIGTYSSTGPTLSRDTVISSSNSDLAVNFDGGSKTVFCTLPSTILSSLAGADIGNFDFTGNTISTNDSSSIIIDQAVNITSNLEVGGDVIPSTDLGSNLGSPTNRFKDLYLSGSTINLGGVSISNVDGEVTIPTLNIGGISLQTSASGSLVIPGITQETTRVAREVKRLNESDNDGDLGWPTDYPPIVIDGFTAAVAGGLEVAPEGWVYATYQVILDDDGNIDEIVVVDGGAGYIGIVETYCRQPMFLAPYGTSWDLDPNTYDPGTFTSIDYYVECGPGEVETIGGGGSLTISNGQGTSIENVTEILINGDNFVEVEPGIIGLTNLGGLDGVTTDIIEEPNIGNEAFTLTLNTANEDTPVLIKVYETDTEVGNEDAPAGPAISIGANNGGSHDNNSIAIGNDDVGYEQDANSIAIGYQAGWGDDSGIGEDAIAIGHRAAYNSAPANSITLNATGVDLSPDESGLFIKPIRSAANSKALYYNTTSGEVTYDDPSGSDIDPNIWVQTVVSSDGAPADNVSMAASVEYDNSGNVIALFLHSTDIVDNDASSSYFSVAKFTAAGEKLWQVRLSSSNTYTDGWGLAVDNIDNRIYVAGRIVVEGNYDQSCLIKLDGSDGSLIWSNIYDFGAESDSPVVDVDSEGNPIVVGYYSTDEFSNDGVTVTKIDRLNGTVIWSRLLDGQGDDEAYGMAVGPDNEVVAIGYMSQLGEEGDTDDRMLVVKYDSTGAIQWQKAIQFDEGYDCRGADADIDADGNIYVCGNYYYSGNAPYPLSAMSIVKFNSSGVKQWSRRVSGNCEDFAASIVVGPDNNLYLSGVTSNNNTEKYIWVAAKYSTSGAVLWQRLLENNGAWSFTGSWWFASGGGSNIAVREGYVALSGAFGIPIDSYPTATVIQLDSEGTTFTTGDWEIKAASFSGTLSSDASDITVVDAEKTDSAITSIAVDDTLFDSDTSNFLIPTRYGFNGADNQLSNGDYTLTLENTGTVTLPAGGTITEGIVTSNPTIQLTPANPTVASQKLVIKGGGAYSSDANGIFLTWNEMNPQVTDTVTIYVLANSYTSQTLYWWIEPADVIADPGFGTVEIDGNGSGSFTFTVNSNDYEFTVRVSPEDNNYNPESIGVETLVFNADAPTFGDHHLHLTTGDLTATSIFLGTDDHNVRTTVDGNIQITTPNETNNVWQFDTDGKFSAPDEVYGNFFTLRGGQAPGDSIGSLGYAGDYPDLYGTAGVRISTGEIEQGPIWEFGADGNVTFPDDTVQTTAYTPDIPQVVPAPDGSSSHMLQMSDRGRHILIDGSFNTIIVPTNATDPLPIGSTIVLVLRPGPYGVVVIPEDEYAEIDIYGAGIGSNEAWIIGAAIGGAMATLIKIDTNSWMLSGTGLAVYGD